MAIKGKSKPKGGARPVTRGPRPAYVPVRKPLVQRRSFWYSILAVVLLASAIGIWYGLAKQRESDREDELAASLRKAATEYQQRVDPILAAVGAPVPPSGFDTFPDLEAALNSLLDGQSETADLDEVASATAETAKGAVGDLEAIEAAQIVAGKGFQQHVVLYVINSRSRMVQGLRLYEQAALLATDAAAAKGDGIVELATRAKELVSLARGIFADGYQDFIEVQFRAGIYAPTVTTGAP